jgi:hypothetical protein
MHSKLQPRPILVQPDNRAIKLIPLTQGKVAIVDAIDYEWLMQFPWYARKCRKTGKFYAFRSLPNRGQIGMHRAILNPPDGFFADHKRPLNTLDNRRENLRVATGTQNRTNTASTLRGEAGYRGVKAITSRGKKTDRWRASISINDVRIHLGCFDDPRAAALAYDAAAKIHHGEFACLNFK